MEFIYKYLNLLNWPLILNLCLTGETLSQEIQVKRVTVNAFLKAGCILLEPRGAAQAEGLEARRAAGSPRAGADAGSSAAPPRGLPGAPRTPRRARPRPRAQEPGAALASWGALAQRPRRRVSDSEEQPRWRTRPPGTGQTPPPPPLLRRPPDTLGCEMCS